MQREATLSYLQRMADAGPSQRMPTHSGASYDAYMRAVWMRSPQGMKPPHCRAAWRAEGACGGRSAVSGHGTYLALPWAGVSASCEEGMELGGDSGFRHGGMRAARDLVPSGSGLSVEGSAGERSILGEDSCRLP